MGSHISDKDFQFKGLIPPLMMEVATPLQNGLGESNGHHNGYHGSSGHHHKETEEERRIRKKRKGGPKRMKLRRSGESEKIRKKVATKKLRKNRNSNVLSAILCLIKEIDGPSLEVVEMAVRC